MSVVKIKRFVDVRPQTIPPLTVSFDCGHLTQNESQEVEGEVLYEERSPERKILMASRRNQMYQGVPSTLSNDVHNTFLLVRNKRNGKAKLIASSSCRLSNSTGPSLTSFLSKSNVEVNPYSTLASTFGSKKLKRGFNISERMKDASASSTILEDTMKSLDDSFQNMSEPAVNNNDVIPQLLPPCNRNASDVSAVYSIEGLLSSGELHDLKKAAKLYLNPPDDVAADKSFLVALFYKSLGANRTLLQVQLLLYANSLLTFCSLRRNEVSSKGAAELICPYSKKIGLKILNEFTAATEQRRVRTPELHDRAICHAAVALLLACSFQLNLEWFFACLSNLRLTHVQMLMRVIGVVPAFGAKDVYILKVPLPPLPSTHKRKKDKR